MRFIVLFVLTIVIFGCSPTTPQEIMEKYSGKWELIVSDSLKQLYPKKFEKTMQIELRRDLTLKVNEDSPFYSGSMGTWRGIEAEGWWIGYLDIDDALNEFSLWSYWGDTVKVGRNISFYDNGNIVNVISIPNEQSTLFKCIKRY